MKRLIVENISKKFRIGFKKRKSALSRFASALSTRESKKDFWALQKVSFSVEKKEVIGIIGRNGCGKSTLLRVVAGIYKPTTGFVKTNGKIISIIDLRAGLKMRLSMRDNIFLCLSLYGLNNKEIRKVFKDVVKFSGLQKYVDTKLYQFSMGMISRLAFSIIITAAVHARAAILLLDEVLSVGDEAFKLKCLKHIKQVSKSGVTVVIVSHRLNALEGICNRIIWMKKGEIHKIGPSKKIVKEYVKLSS